MDVLFKVTIDGREVNVPPGTTVLTAAKQVGIEIPTFCHYAKLTPIGACRMCLVEIEKIRALQTACTTKVQEGMVVRTNTPEVVKTRQGVLEFLLTNHPLDCPVCDKGGECDLQDQVFRFGGGVSRFVEEKRHKRKAYPLSPFIVMDEERCVLCRRCARFMEEWADEPELVLYERGARTVMTTFPGRQLQGHFAGNAVEICPVGALTSRPFRFGARSWELARTPSVCTLCGVGCNVGLDTKARRLRRIVARPNPDVNDEWLCDRGRFGHAFEHSANRLTQPLVRHDGKLEPASWDEALSVVAARLSELSRAATPDVVGAVGSARATNEANYLLQKLMRAGVGTNNVDFVARPPEGADPLPDPSAVQQADVVVLIGVDPASEAPMLDLWLRRGWLTRKARVVGVAARRPGSVRAGGLWVGCRPGSEVAAINGLLHLLAARKEAAGDKRPDLLAGVRDYAPASVAAQTGASEQDLRAAADLLGAAQRPVILYGQAALHGPLTADTLKAIGGLAAVVGGPAAYVTEYNNALGALAMGVCPARYPGGSPVEDPKARDSFGKRWNARLSPRPGLAVHDMMAAARQGKLQALYVMGCDLVTQLPGAAESLPSLRLLVVQDLFMNATASLADVVLPAASSYETDGTIINVASRVQLLRPAVPAAGEARPDWRILSDLGEKMGGAEDRRGKSDAWSYAGAEDVWREVARAVPEFRELSYGSVGAAGKGRTVTPAKARYTTVTQPAIAGDPAYPLRLSMGRAFWDKGTLLSESEAVRGAAGEACLEMNPADVVTGKLASGDRVKVISPYGDLSARLLVTAAVAPGCVWLARNMTDKPLASILAEGGDVTWVRVGKG